MPKRVDVNQQEIVQAVRQAGATVQVLSAVGKGCPDLVVGFRGRNHLWEVKDGNKPPSRRRLTTDEIEWHMAWHGQVDVVYGVEHALTLLGAL